MKRMFRKKSINLFLIFCLSDTYHVADDELILECRIRGHPIPTIMWMKDAIVLASDSRYSMNYLADGVCRLIINHPNKSDAGKYTCKAENSIWSDQIYHDVYFAGDSFTITYLLYDVIDFFF